MKRIGSVFAASFRSSIKGALAYPADLLFELIFLPVNTFVSFLTIFVVARNTLLGGWNFGALLALGGTHMLIGGVMSALVEPNLGYFCDRVLDGKLDDILVMPVPSLFAATLLRQAPTRLLTACAGFAAVIVGGVLARASAAGWLLFALALPVSLTLAWALRTVFASVCFYSRGNDLTVVYSAVWQFQRYPTGIYPSFLRAGMYAVPFALIAMPPALCLVRANPLELLPGLGALCLMVPLACFLWKAGTRRYASSTS